MFLGQASNKFNNSNHNQTLNKQTLYPPARYGVALQSRKLNFSGMGRLRSLYDPVTVLMAMTKWQKSHTQVTGVLAQHSVCATFIKWSLWLPPAVL